MTQINETETRNGLLAGGARGRKDQMEINLINNLSISDTVADPVIRAIIDQNSCREQSLPRIQYTKHHPALYL